ncbi:Galactosyltransferase [Paenibacillus sp. P1XP2]|nr:Galactosyltransferase [Paenibacillus sp. P1XP2]
MEAGDISVLIPYQSDGGPRDEALRFVRSFYKRVLPEAEICVGELTGETFSRSKAINKAASAATGSRWIIADGDLIYDPELIRGALRQLREDNWIIPFTSITRLTLSNSQSAYRSEAVWPLQVPVETKPDDARYFVGGVSVVTRTAFETIGGYDERFIGWGGEDEAFAYSMDTIIGKHIRLEGNLLHFWHPFVGPSGNPHYGQNYALFQEYRKALGHRAEMSRLIQGKQEGRTTA